MIEFQYPRLVSPPVEACFILPTTELMENFHGAAACATCTDYCAVELVSAAVAALEPGNMQHLLWCAERHFDKWSRELGTDTASILSKAWLELAMGLFRLAIGHNLFDESRRFQYFFKGMIGDDILIERFPPAIPPAFGVSNDRFGESEVVMTAPGGIGLRVDPSMPPEVLSRISGVGTPASRPAPLGTTSGNNDDNHSGTGRTP